MTTLLVGQEILFAQWETDVHVEYSALIRSIAGDPDDTNVTVNLSWQDGPNSTNENNVVNIENFPTPAAREGSNYWRRNLVAPNLANSFPLRTEESFRGEQVWLFQTPPGGEPAARPAIIRSILGGPGQANANINCFYIDDAGNRINASNIPPVETNGTSSGDFWAKRYLGAGEGFV